MAAPRVSWKLLEDARDRERHNAARRLQEPGSKIAIARATSPATAALKAEPRYRVLQGAHAACLIGAGFTPAATPAASKA
jgi:hypothetical protein